MTSDGVENQPGKRDQDHIGRIGGEIAHHADKDYDWRQERLGRPADPGAHGGTQKPGTLRHAGAEHHHKHVAERVEVRERLRHFDPQPANILRRDQADRGNDAGRTGGLVDLGGMKGRPARQRGDDGDHDQCQYQPEEQEHGVRQAIAGPLDPAKDAFVHLSACRCRFAHACLHPERR